MVNSDTDILIYPV